MHLKYTLRRILQWAFQKIKLLKFNRKKTTEAYCCQLKKKNSVSCCTYEKLCRTYEILIRTNEILSRTYEILIRTYERPISYAELPFVTPTIQQLAQEIDEPIRQISAQFKQEEDQKLTRTNKNSQYVKKDKHILKVNKVTNI